MQQGSGDARGQIAERVKSSTNILVTVSSNPSVDALSAALALTLMLNKLDKHATAVMSGTIPPAINFLEPNKTFERNVDSLRDFIIALDRDKADRLRYKLEDDVVKIFITPYRTTITDRDLQFSQGDFNVDLIIALGVEQRDELDKAITAHGRILHDAMVVTMNAGTQKSSLGAIDLQDGAASSLCEMLAGFAETLQHGLLDQQISTALLTGIVSATDRFSNQRTTPQVMTLAAQLMAAGANQQLIATNLSQTSPIPTDRSAKLVKTEQAPSAPAPEAAARGDGVMEIKHEDRQKQSRPAPVTEQPPVVPPSEPPLPVEPTPVPPVDIKRAIEEDTAKEEPHVLPSPSAPENNKEKAVINAAVTEPEEPKIEHEKGYLNSQPSWKGRTIQPTFGGTLNATAEQALEDSQRAEQDDRNRQILSHEAPMVETKAPSAPKPAPAPKKAAKSNQPPKPPAAPPPATPPASPPPAPPASPPEPPAPATPAPAPPQPPSAPSLTDQLPPLEPEPTPAPAPSAPAPAPADVDAARAEVNALLEAQPQPNERAADIGAQPLPPVSEPPLPPPVLSMAGTPLPPPVQAPAAPAPAMPPSPLQPPAMSELPPLPDFSQLPPLPAEQTPAPLPPVPGSVIAPPPPAPGPVTPSPESPADPGQFRIPT